VDLFLQALFGGLTSGSIYAIIALGFSLVYRSTTVVNFAQGEFAMLGGLIAVSGVTALKLPLPGAVMLAVLITALIGVAVERTLVRPVRKQPVFVVILLTLAASSFFRGAAMVVWGKDPLTLPSFSGEQPLAVGGATILPQTFWILGTAIVVMALLSLVMNQTIYGKALRACAENPRAATLMGIDVGLVVMASFALSAALGGLAGVLVTPVTAMEFQFGFGLAMKGLTGALIGGLERTSGVIVGALLLGLIEALGATYVSSLMKDAMAFAVLIAILIVRPNGLLGKSAQ
jgi:branched-chain amino acid transport system permease protein